MLCTFYCGCQLTATYWECQLKSCLSSASSQRSYKRVLCGLRKQPRHHVNKTNSLAAIASKCRTRCYSIKKQNALLSQTYFRSLLAVLWNKFIFNLNDENIHKLVTKHWFLYKVLISLEIWLNYSTGQLQMFCSSPRDCIGVVLNQA